MHFSTWLLEPMRVPFPRCAPGPVFDNSITFCRAFFEAFLVITVPSCGGIPPSYCISTSCVGNSGIDIAVSANRSKFTHTVYTLLFEVGNSGILCLSRLLFSFHLCNRLCMHFILTLLFSFQVVDLGRGFSVASCGFLCLGLKFSFILFISFLFIFERLKCLLVRNLFLNLFVWCFLHLCGLGDWDSLIFDEIEEVLFYWVVEFHLCVL